MDVGSTSQIGVTRFAPGTNENDHTTGMIVTNNKRFDDEVFYAEGFNWHLVPVKYDGAIDPVALMLPKGNLILIRNSNKHVFTLLDKVNRNTKEGLKQLMIALIQYDISHKSVRIKDLNGWLRESEAKEISKDEDARVVTLAFSLIQELRKYTFPDEDVKSPLFTSDGIMGDGLFLGVTFNRRAEARVNGFCSMRDTELYNAIIYMCNNSEKLCEIIGKEGAHVPAIYITTYGIANGDKMARTGRSRWVAEVGNVGTFTNIRDYQNYEEYNSTLSEVTRNKDDALNTDGIRVVVYDPKKRFSNDLWWKSHGLVGQVKYSTTDLPHLDVGDYWDSSGFVARIVDGVCVWGEKLPVSVDGLHTLGIYLTKSLAHQAIPVEAIPYVNKAKKQKEETKKQKEESEKFKKKHEEEKGVSRWLVAAGRGIGAITTLFTVLIKFYNFVIK